MPPERASQMELLPRPAIMSVTHSGAVSNPPLAYYARSSYYCRCIWKS